MKSVSYEVYRDHLTRTMKTYRDNRVETEKVIYDLLNTVEHGTEEQCIEAITQFMKSYITHRKLLLDKQKEIFQEIPDFVDDKIIRSWVGKIVIDSYIMHTYRDGTENNNPISPFLRQGNDA